MSINFDTMMRRPPSLDLVFRALADPTRRAILEQLERGGMRTSVLAANFDMALPSFIQHLTVLVQCGLVKSMKPGRIRTYRLTPQGLKTAYAWLGKRRRAAPKELRIRIRRRAPKPAV